MNQRGLTVIELLVALVIGVAVLGAGIGFMINSSKSIKLGEDNARNTSVAQQVLSKLVKELKGVNTESPPLYGVNPSWASLFALPYDAIETTPTYMDTSGSAVLPTVPAARKFASQVGATDMAHKWYPNPTGDESNSLVFYKAPPPGPGGTSFVQRITYRLQAGSGKLVREVQSPLTGASSTFYANPVPQTSVLANEVQLIQFSYPIFEQQMNTALNTQLTAMPAAERQAFINTNFRKVIGIRLVLGGAKIQSKMLKGIELKTEVRLRSE